MNAFRRSWMTVVFTLGFAAVLAVQAQDAAKDLQGNWAGEHKDKKMTFRFEKENFTVQHGDEEIIGTFKVEASKTPRTIDMTVTGGRGQVADGYSGKTALGIYEVSGDKLKWCACEPGKDARPQDFNEGDGHIYVQFERVKK
jgi:uncharacterized protein (TIGR03067 family)